MELAEAGENSKELRSIAKNLIKQAGKDDPSALSAIKEIADRLDGKPAQSIENGENGPLRVTVSWKK